MELDIEALDSLSDVELAELAQRLRNDALAADAHAYALLGYLNDRRKLTLYPRRFFGSVRAA